MPRTRQAASPWSPTRAAPIRSARCCRRIWIAMLAEMPIDGLEAHYRSHTDEQTALYRRLADEKGLLISAGSDSHAPHQPVNPRPWRAIWAADLLARLGITVEPVAEGEAGLGARHGPFSAEAKAARGRRRWRRLWSRRRAGRGGVA